jgi:hypothetical protein
MKVAQMILELRSQRNHLDEAILALERLAVSGPKKRGRPPKLVTDAAMSKFSHNGVNGAPGRRGQALGATGS